MEELAAQLKRVYYSLSAALQQNWRGDMLKNLDVRGEPLWVLGNCYKVLPSDSDVVHSEVLAALVLHVKSIPLMTYRYNFPPILSQTGGQDATTDVGWSCTLRSGQMLLAHAMLRDRTGNNWRLSDTSSNLNVDHMSITSYFWDVPSAPLSLHSLCMYGKPWGVQPGRWLGPYVVCKTLETSASHHKLIQIWTLGQGGGGAPVLPVYEICKVLDAPRSSSGLVLLVPLVLGIGKLNPCYIPQLKAVFRMSASVGIVGGRPGSSFYFIGYQDGSLLYLDPHDAQEAATGSIAVHSFVPQVVGTLGFDQVESSLAIGFYCADQSAFHQLCKELADLECQYRLAPLICVSDKNGSIMTGDTWNDDAEGCQVPDELEDRQSTDATGWELL